MRQPQRKSHLSFFSHDNRGPLHELLHRNNDNDNSRLTKIHHVSRRHAKSFPLMSGSHFQNLHQNHTTTTTTSSLPSLLRKRRLNNPVHHPTTTTSTTTATTTKKRPKPKKLRHLLRVYSDEVRDAEIENWLMSKKKFPKSRWKVKDKRTLRSWFDRLDVQQTGEIDVGQVTEPLLSSGLVKTVSEVNHLVQIVDEDQTGKINFNKFLNIMRYNGHGLAKVVQEQKQHQEGRLSTKIQSGASIRQRSSKDLLFNGEIVKEHSQNSKNNGNERGDNRRPKKLNRHELSYESRVHGSTDCKGVDPITKLHSMQKEKGEMDISSFLSVKRRKFLLDAIMGETNRRAKSLDKIHQWRKEVNESNGLEKFRKLHEIAKLTQKLESDQIEKDQMVMAMKGVLEASVGQGRGDKNKSIISSPIKHLMKKADDSTKEEDNVKRNFMMLARDREHEETDLIHGRHALVYAVTSRRSDSILAPKRHQNEPFIFPSDMKLI